MKAFYDNLIFLKEKFKSLGFLKSIVLYYTFIFFRLEFIERIEKRKLYEWEDEEDYDEDELTVDYSGYYLVKRRWVWYLLSSGIIAIILFFDIILSIKKVFNYIHSYETRWMPVKGKLTFKQEVNFRIKLF